MKRLTLVFLFSLCGNFLFAGSTDPVTQHKNTNASQAGFLENRGQMRTMDGKPAGFVLFKTESPGLDLYVTNTGLTYVFLEHAEEKETHESAISFESESEERFVTKWQKVTLELEGAQLSATNVIKELPQQGVKNYYRAGAENTVTGVQIYLKLTFRNVYPGIDWILYNEDSNGFKYDFVVHAGADASQIRWKCSSPQKPLIDGDGAFVVNTRFGTLKENAPESYLKNGGKQVKSNFSISGMVRSDDYWSCNLMVNTDPAGSLSNEVLVIDPQVTWCTLYGGNGPDGVMAIDTDPTGNLFAIGYNYSSNFPLMNAGTFYSTSGTTTMTKFSNSGALLWCTYFGNAGGSSEITSLVCDLTGNVFICGQAGAGSGVPLLNSGSYYQGTWSGSSDAFISKFSNAGQLLWSTPYGGSSYDLSYDLATDQSGNIFVCGLTHSTNFPVQNGGGFFQPVIQTTVTGAGFLLKFDNAGNRIWATLLDAMFPHSLATDPAGNIFISGAAYTNTGSALPLQNPGAGAYYQGIASGNNDVFISKFSGSSQLLWGTYYGGSGSETPVFGTTTDKNGNLFLSGTTTSTNFPLMNAGTFFQSVPSSTLSESFILKFSNTGVRQWATYFGGNGGESSSSRDNLATDSCGNLYLSFETGTNNIVTQAACDGGYFAGTGPGSQDGFLARFHNNGALDWATYLGGNAMEYRQPLAVDPYGNLFVSGEWQDSQNPSPSIFNPLTYPLLNPGGTSYFDATHNSDHDSFFLKFGNGAPSTFSYQTVCSGTSAPAMPVLGSGFVSGGSFTGSAGLSVNSSNGQINTGSSLPGIHTVTYMPPSGSPTCVCIFTAASTATVLISQVSVSVPSVQICTGNSATLASSVTTTSPANYVWHPSGPNTSTWLVTPASSAYYTLQVTNAEGCSAQATVVVAVAPLPTVSITGPTLECAGHTFTFQANGAFVYNWSFGASGPTAAISPVGNTGFSITGTNVFGCVHTATAQVIVENCSSMDETDQGDLFNVYPNPSSSDFVIWSAAGANITVENAIGQLILRASFQPNDKQKITLAGHAPGIYTIRGESAGKTLTHKIILQKDQRR
jgi:hypothetical protein